MTHLVTPILILLLSLIPCALRAQTFVGFQGSNYAGIFAVDLQPASIADNRLKYDVSLFGLSTTASNNYIRIGGNALVNGDFRNITSDNYRGFLLEELNGKAKSLYLNYDVQLPGFMVALSPKQGIAVTSRWRSFLNIDGLEEPGARFAFNLLDLPPQFGEEYSNPGLRINLLNYFELGLGYGRVLYDSGPHFLKGGVRLKLLSGLAGISAYADSLRYSFADDHTLSVQQANISYAHSTILDGIENDFNLLRDFGKLRFNDVGLGLDLGLVYEHRPDHEEYHLGEGENRVPMQDKNKYAFRLGISVLDIGGIPFAQSQRSQNFSGTVLNYDLNQLDLRGVADFDSTIGAEFVLEQGGEDFTMAMPTALSMQLDVRLHNRIYLNLSPYFAFKRSGNQKGVHSITHVSLTPRWESKWLGLGIPFSASDAGSFDVGFMFQAGPVVVGSSNMTSALFGNNMRGADIRVGFRAPIPYKRTKAGDLPPATAPKDPETLSEARPERPAKEKKAARAEKAPENEKPKAGITNRPKETPPATDPVAESTAPETPRPETPTAPAAETPPAPEVATTPETPASATRPGRDTPAPPEVSGPVQAETKAPQQQQPAPEIAQTTERPGTFLPERPATPKEKTPVDYGPINVTKPEFSPDRPFVNETTIQYLPYADADGDGVINRDDLCPDLPGLAALNGCPPEEDPTMENADYQEIDAFHRLYFDMGSTELGPFEKEMLRQVAFVLKGNPGKTLLIHGHSDGSATEKRNENLARQRCEATRDYLMARGIPQQRLIVIPHGADRPASTNLSENGRSLNRRVELVLDDN